MALLTWSPIKTICLPGSSWSTGWEVRDCMYTYKPWNSQLQLFYLRVNNISTYTLNKGNIEVPMQGIDYSVTTALFELKCTLIWFDWTKVQINRLRCKRLHVHLQISYDYRFFYLWVNKSGYCRINSEHSELKCDYSIILAKVYMHLIWVNKSDQQDEM